MAAFATTLIASVAAFLISSASAVSSDTALSKVVHIASFAHRDPDAPIGYSPLRTAKINGNRFAVYALQNGARPDDRAGEGQGSADVFDNGGRLIWRFTFKENLNSPPQIEKYVSEPER
jgi:hypothetical protein